MRISESPSRTDLALELLVAFGVQLGLSRVLAKVCTSAEEHEFEPVAAPRQIRRLRRPAASTLA